VLLWGYGIARFLPGIKTVFEGVNILETMVQQYFRRTGAGTFVVSGAVSDNGSFAGQLFQMLL
jgi:hypothetical protein